MTKTKQQLRAEAVERLRKLDKDNSRAADVVYAITPDYKGASWAYEVDTLIDLLTDDCDTECYECARLAELTAENSVLRVQLDELKAMNEKLQVALDAVEGCDERCKKLESERDEWKAKAEAKSAKRAAAVERLKDARYHTLADYVRAMLGWGHEPHFEDCRDALIGLLTDEDAQRDSNGTCPDAMGQASDENATCNNSGVFVTDDSRENLEEDANGYVMSWWQSDWVDSFGHADSMKRDIMRLLERQAAITANELTEQLESAHAKNRSLKAHIAKMQEGRHGWHVKYPELERKNAELQAKVDELTENYEASSRALEILTSDKAELQTRANKLTERKCPGYEPENHYCRYHHQDFELNHQMVSRLKRRIAELERECAKLSDDEFYLRCTLADINGEVVG